MTFSKLTRLHVILGLFSSKFPSERRRRNIFRILTALTANLALTKSMFRTLFGPHYSTFGEVEATLPPHWTMIKP